MELKKKVITETLFKINNPDLIDRIYKFVMYMYIHKSS